MASSLVCDKGYQELDNSRLSLSPSLSFFVISFLFFLLLIDATNTIIGPILLQKRGIT